ncbi:MAG: RNA methyltransferase [Proteobacteria bacterium]|nr:RNA methyltransferase [Pseudomonadota bacterium]
MAEPVIILVEPQLAENIGAAARAMLNCGLNSLRLVQPRPDWPSERARNTSAGAESVLDAAGVFRSIADATGDLQRVFAMSGRVRDLVKLVLTPPQAVAEIRAAIAGGERVGVLFGPERAGLLNDDVALVDAVIAVPLNPAFHSLNLAQAVLILAYEWLKADDRTPPLVLQTGDSAVAGKAHLMSFLTRLEAELDDCGFLRNADKRPGMVQNIRAMFGRAQLTDQEIRTLHGILTELVTKRLRE